MYARLHKYLLCMPSLCVSLHMMIVSEEEREKKSTDVNCNICEGENIMMREKKTRARGVYCGSQLLMHILPQFSIDYNNSLQWQYNATKVYKTTYTEIAK